MKTQLCRQMLAQVPAGFAVLCIRDYALPVQYRVDDQRVECVVPTWSNMDDVVGKLSTCALLTICAADGQRWIFIRGSASVMPEPDWEDFKIPTCHTVDPMDLYQVLQITPKRIELVDETKGWGYRETMDL